MWCLCIASVVAGARVGGRAPILRHAVQAHFARQQAPSLFAGIPTVASQQMGRGCCFAAGICLELCYVNGHNPFPGLQRLRCSEWEWSCNFFARFAPGCSRAQQNSPASRYTQSPDVRRSCEELLGWAACLAGGELGVIGSVDGPAHGWEAAGLFAGPKRMSVCWPPLNRRGVMT